MRRRTRLAIDAANFAHDARGLGRIARPVVTRAFRDDRFDVTLLAEKRADVRALRAEFPDAAIEPPSAARRRGRYDVVWFPFNGMRYRVAAPAVVSIADAFAFAEPHRSRVARFREQAPMRRAARKAARIVTISQWSRGEIARSLGVSPERIEAIVPAPDPYWFPAPGDTLPDVIADTRFALVVGATEARKNVRLALEACALAFAAPDEWLVVVGRLSDADRAFARARDVRAGEIAASDATLRALYRNAAVVLVPSLAEGFGLVAVEALACGAPVLAADAAALPEATAGEATLLDPRDSGAWARAIRAAFDDVPDPEAESARARRFAAIDRDAPARRLLALLDEVARSVAAP